MALPVDRSGPIRVKRPRVPATPHDLSESSLRRLHRRLCCPSSPAGAGQEEVAEEGIAGSTDDYLLSSLFFFSPRCFFSIYPLVIIPFFRSRSFSAVQLAVPHPHSGRAWHNTELLGISGRDLGVSFFSGAPLPFSPSPGCLFSHLYPPDVCFRMRGCGAVSALFFPPLSFAGDALSLSVISTAKCLLLLILLFFPSLTVIRLLRRKFAMGAFSISANQPPRDRGSVRHRIHLLSVPGLLEVESR